MKVKKLVYGRVTIFFLDYIQFRVLINALWRNTFGPMEE